MEEKFYRLWKRTSTAGIHYTRSLIATPLSLATAAWVTSRILLPTGKEKIKHRWQTNQHVIAEEEMNAH